jgi:hypothetical protein
MAEVYRRMDWKILLTYITGSVEQALLLRNESLVTENRILRHQIQGRIRLNDGNGRPLPRLASGWGSRRWQRS